MDQTQIVALIIAGILFIAAFLVIEMRYRRGMRDAKRWTDAADYIAIYDDRD